MHKVATNTPSNLGAMSSGLRRDPRTLTNLPEILSSLSSFQSEEAQLSNSLAELLKARDPIHVSLNRLQSLVPQLDKLHIDATQLTRKVSNTAKTAERVGSRVRSLDEEMGRVRQAGDRVAQVMELKVSIISTRVIPGIFIFFLYRRPFPRSKHLLIVKIGNQLPRTALAPCLFPRTFFLVLSQESLWSVKFSSNAKKK